MEPHIHLAVNISSIVKISKTHRCRHKPSKMIFRMHSGDARNKAYFSRSGCPISPKWSIVGCISTTSCRISLDSHASSRKWTAISHTSGAGSYSWVSNSRRVQAFAFADALIKSPRWWVAYKRMCWQERDISEAESLKKAYEVPCNLK